MPVSAQAKTACSRMTDMKSWLSGPWARGGDAESCLAAIGPSEGANPDAKPARGRASSGGSTGCVAHGAANTPLG